MSLCKTFFFFSFAHLRCTRETVNIENIISVTFPNILLLHSGSDNHTLFKIGKLFSLVNTSCSTHVTRLHRLKSTRLHGQCQFPAPLLQSYAIYLCHCHDGVAACNKIDIQCIFGRYISGWMDVYMPKFKIYATYFW